MPTWKQGVTGADAGEYLAAGQDIPLDMTYAGKMKEGWQNTKEGIAAMMGKIPSISNFLNKFGIQNFESLPPLDQAFIKQSSGYRGPTVFGENTSGLNKDPFGLNVESLFGNYAEAVRDDVDKLSGHLTKSAEKRGLTFDPVQGALVDAAGNVIDEEDYTDAMTDFMSMTKNIQQRNKYYKGVDQNFNTLKNNFEVAKKQRAAWEKETARELDEADKRFTGPHGTGDYDEYAGAGGTPNFTIHDPSTTAEGYSYEGSDEQDKANEGASNTGGASYSRPGASGHPTGHHWADGGRVGLRYGGLLSIL